MNEDENRIAFTTGDKQRQTADGYGHMRKNRTIYQHIDNLLANYVRHERQSYTHTRGGGGEELVTSEN